MKIQDAVLVILAGLSGLAVGRYGTVPPPTVKNDVTIEMDGAQMAISWAGEQTVNSIAYSMPITDSSGRAWFGSCALSPVDQRGVP